MASRGSHRHGDSRVCGAKTEVHNQSTVFVNDRLWAVEGDPNNHKAGGLIATSGKTVYIEDKLVIVHGPDHAQPDIRCWIEDGKHCDPATDEGSGDVFAYA